MSIDNPNAKIADTAESSEHLLTGIFTPGDRTSMEQQSAREVLNQNDMLVAQVHEQAVRIAAAAAKTLNGMPESYRQSFLDGVSCFNKPDDLVFNALRQQMNA
jgi:hypothetical protein